LFSDCRARGICALAYLGADRSRRRAYGGVDVARRIVMKLAFRSMRVARKLPQGFQMGGRDRSSCRDRIVYAAAVAWRQRDLKLVLVIRVQSPWVSFARNGHTATSRGFGAVLQNVFPRRDWRSPSRRCRPDELSTAPTRGSSNALAGMNISARWTVAAVYNLLSHRGVDGIPGFSGFAAKSPILIARGKSYPLRSG